MAVPDRFVCPLTLDVMTDPVMSRYGQSFERDAILQWLEEGHKECPCTRRPLGLRDIVSNHQLRLEIRRWQVQTEQTVTVMMEQSDHEFRGIVTLPEKDEDDTERSDDDVSLTEVSQLENVPPTGRRFLRFIRRRS